MILISCPFVRFKLAYHSPPPMLPLNAREKLDGANDQTPSHKSLYAPNEGRAADPFRLCKNYYG